MNWKEELQNNITSVAQLAQMLPLDPAELSQLEQIADAYPMSIPRYYLSQVDPRDPDDPIRRMCVPSVLELDDEGRWDTSGEQQSTVLEGLQHKYAQTALILSTNVCAMYCRHCFRKRMVGMADDEVATQYGPIAEYLRRHREINNVLISGGDSFLNSNRMIGRYLETLCEMDHLDFIRFGTRVPVSFPCRITEDPELTDLLRRYAPRKRIYVTTQFNHPRELTREALDAVNRLIDCGIIVSNQTVLLRGVNDRPEVLADLLRGLTRAGVVPYYIFQCRPVARVKNQFQVPLLEGHAIVEAAKALSNGYAKRLKYAMSHDCGKLEILGPLEGKMAFKYHEARDPAKCGKLFTRALEPDQGWL